MDMNVLIGIGVAIVILLVFDIALAAYERKTKESDFDILSDAIEDLYDTCEKMKIGSPIEEMTANEYQNLAARTINWNLANNEKAFHALYGMVGEVGEIHSIYQKLFQGHELDFDHIKKEVGDLLWFIAELCTAYGWNLEDVMYMNIIKLKERYPEGFDPDKSLHRKEGDV